MPVSWGNNVGGAGPAVWNQNQQFQAGAVYGANQGPTAYQFTGALGPGGAQGYGTWKALDQRTSRGNGMLPTAPQAPAPASPQTPTPGQGGGGLNIQTSIQPQRVFGNNDTRGAQNLAYAQGSLPLPWLLQQYARPGMSTDSPGMVSQALPQIAQARLQGWQQHQSIPFEDDYQNAQSMLRGQQAREGEALGLAGALANVNAADKRFQVQNASSLMNLLGSFIGNQGGMGGGLMGMLGNQF